MSASTIVDPQTGLQKDQGQFGKGQRLFTGPDGVGDHRVTILDPTYIGEGAASVESTSSTDYLFRAPKEQSPPRRRSQSSHVGGIGWGIPQQQDMKLLKSDHQIKVGQRGPFRQANEDRYTHRLQAPWYGVPNQYGVAQQAGSRRTSTPQHTQGPRFTPPQPSSTSLASSRSQAESAASLHSHGSFPPE